MPESSDIIRRRAGRVFTAMARKRRVPPAHDQNGLDAWGALEEAELALAMWALLEAEQNSGYSALEAVPDDEAKAAQEFSDCRDFAAELRAEHGLPLCEIDVNPEDALPDCVGTMDGKRVGIEVTRLTIAPQEIGWQRKFLRSNIEVSCSSIEKDEPERAREIRKALEAKPFKFSRALKHIAPYEQVLLSPPWPEWPFEYFQDRLRAVIHKKVNIAAARAKEGRIEEFDKLFLLVRTHEYNLTEDRVDDYLQRVMVSDFGCFDAAYLKLPGVPMDGPGRRRYPVFRIPSS